MCGYIISFCCSWVVVIECHEVENGASVTYFRWGWENSAIFIRGWTLDLFRKKKKSSPWNLFDISLVAGSIPALTAHTEWHSANTTLSPEQFTQQLTVLSIRADWFSLLKKFFLYSLIFFLLSPSLCWCWQLILWPSFILATANFGENKNPAPLIRLEGLQIEFSPSQCPLSWLSLGAKAGPWQRSKHQLTEFEMLESWQANEGNWRAVGIL